MPQPAHDSPPFGTAPPRPGAPMAGLARAGGGNQRVPAGLEQVLLGLSWASPASHALATDAVTRLARTHSALAAYTGPALAPAPLARLVDGLRTRIGFVLEYWSVELAALEPGEWTAVHTQALERDLREIASSGAPALNLVTGIHHLPATVTGRAPTVGRARHREGGERGYAAPAAETVAHALGRLPEGGARLLAQAAGIVVAAAVVAVICFESFHRPLHAAASQPARTGSPHGASTPSPTPSGRAASTSPSKNLRTTAAGRISSLQMQLLGASAAQPRIEVIIYLDTADTAPVTVAISYRAQGDTSATTTTRTASGHTTYQIALPIDAAVYCDRAVLVTAQAGGLAAGDSTSAGPCAGTSASPSTDRSDT